MSALLHTNNTRDNYKDIRKRIIPLDVYLTWGTKNLPNKMNERVETFKKQNPQFKYHLFDDNDCREFIKNHFREDVLYAYDHLIPGAYKADLWRYCVLFINGGIYLDIKLSCVNGFKLIGLTNKEHFVKDRPANSVYNALMCCRKGNILLFMAIRQIVANVKSRYYGKTALSPTGPELLGSIILKYKIPVNIDMTHYHGGGYVIYKKRFVISTEYKEYNHERNVLYRKNDTKRYDKLWASRNIYK
jgi:mannosyltransferase OCH1-like enzyme